MAKYQPGEYVTVEFKDENTGQSERLWVAVHLCDDEERFLFGRLDNEPVVGTSFRLGDELAVSYERVVEHWKGTEFKKQQNAGSFGYREWPVSGVGTA